MTVPASLPSNAPDSKPEALFVLTPYYADEWVTLYHGDCLDVLPTLLSDSVDAVVTDPPYASGTTEAAKPGRDQMLRGTRFATPIENDRMTTPGFVWLIREIAKATKPLLKEGGSFLSFIDWRQWPSLVGALESTNLRVQTMVVWNKVNFGMGNGFRSQHELICHAAKGTPTITSRAVGNVINCPREANPDHPSPKPVGLMAEIVLVVAPVGGVVLDPFTGSGSTLVAAKSVNRKAIGVEIEERYCEIAARRLSQGILDFEEPA